ncbi:hypothetical protein D9M68_981180 [compost metagenome]
MKSIGPLSRFVEDELLDAPRDEGETPDRAKGWLSPMPLAWLSGVGLTKTGPACRGFVASSSRDAASGAEDATAKDP